MDGSAGTTRVERRAEALLRCASSLLLFQSALSGEAAQAFLKASAAAYTLGRLHPALTLLPSQVLAALRAGRDGGLPALQAYGVFFAKLAQEGRTWPDSLLDAIIVRTYAPRATSALR